MNPKVIPIYAHQEDCRLVKASVKGVSKQSLMIDLNSGVVNAQTAFSCLVAPMVGDTVLVSQSDGDYHVLAVLERAAKQDMALNFPASVKMTALDGQIDMIAGRDVNVLSTAKTNLLSAEINMTSGEMNVNSGKLTAHTTDVESHSQTMKLYTQMFSSVARQVTQKTDILVRWVEQVETLNIGNLIQNVRKNYTSHSDQAVITASKDMRIDGERIHMG
jgi:hypothetical protein|tara:strand:+ start:1601 stop:2254 length:654 start_codon:yes stop_codon:yes gene_type:complete